MSDDLGAFVNGLPAPKVSGIYFLHSGTDVVYVGQAIDIRKRIGNHLTEGVKSFDRFSWIPIPQHLLDKREREYIGRFAPRYNRCSLANDARLMAQAGWGEAGKVLAVANKGSLSLDDAARFLGISTDALLALGESGPPYRNSRYSRSRVRRRVYPLNDLREYAQRAIDAKPTAQDSEGKGSTSSTSRQRVPTED